MAVFYKSHLCTQGRLSCSPFILVRVGDIRSGPDCVVNERAEQTQSIKKYFGLDEKIAINIDYI